MKLCNFPFLSGFSLAPLTKQLVGTKLESFQKLDGSNQMFAAGGGPSRPWGKRGECFMMPLALAKPGETCTIVKVTGKDEVRQHLAELGFVVDSAVTVVSQLGGNLILQVKDSRVALDRGMASRIMVGPF